MPGEETTDASPLVELFHRIVDERDVRVAFQPVVDLRSGEVVALEALARGPAGSELESPHELFTTTVTQTGSFCGLRPLPSDKRRAGLEAAVSEMFATDFGGRAAVRSGGGAGICRDSCRPAPQPGTSPISRIAALA